MLKTGQANRIRLKRVYDPVSADEGRIIFVDKLRPRGISKEKAGIDEWIKDIAPSDELRKWFSHGPAKWQEFRSRYRKELKHRDKSELIDGLRKFDNKRRKYTPLFSERHPS